MRTCDHLIIIIIECKDYSNGIPVDDVEEFHAKLQQIGADNTKGMMITKNGCFQRSALTYAESKGIALARIIPPNQVEHVLFKISGDYKETEAERRERIIRPLIEKYYVSFNQDFYSSTDDCDLDILLLRFLGIDY